MGFLLNNTDVLSINRLSRQFLPFYYCHSSHRLKPVGFLTLFHLKDSTWYALLRGVLSSVFGCQSETRTHNLRINSALLYRLSYPTICRITLAILQNIIKGVVFNYKLFVNCKTKIKLWDIIFFSKILTDKISLNENNTLITNNYWLIVTSCSFTKQLVFKS